jgi:hypothetical protein
MNLHILEARMCLLLLAIAIGAAAHPRVARQTRIPCFAGTQGPTRVQLVEWRRAKPSDGMAWPQLKRHGCNRQLDG